MYISFPRWKYIPYRLLFKSNSRVISSTLTSSKNIPILSAHLLLPMTSFEVRLTSRYMGSHLVFLTINLFSEKTTKIGFNTLTQSTQLRRILQLRYSQKQVNFVRLQQVNSIAVTPRLKSPIFPTIYLELEGEYLDIYLSQDIYFCTNLHISLSTFPGHWLECSPMARETWVQSQVELYQRLNK